MKAQCEDLLAALRRGPMTTGQIRNRLGIGQPATRIWELKQMGYDIVTDRVAVTTRRGKARVAKYRLVAAPAARTARAA